MDTRLPHTDGYIRHLNSDDPWSISFLSMYVSQCKTLFSILLGFYINVYLLTDINKNTGVSTIETHYLDYHLLIVV